MRITIRGLDTWLPRQFEQSIVAATALGSGVAAVFASGMPTGLRLWDGVLRFLLATVVVMAWSKSPRWLAIVGAGTAAAAVGFSAWAILAWVALFLAFATVFVPKRIRLFGAIIGALAVQSLLRIPAFGFFGLPSLISGGVFLLALVQGYRYSSAKVRRRSRRAVSGLFAITAAILLVGGVQLLNARSEVDRGVAAARRVLQGAREGDTAAVLAELELAEAALTSASARVDGGAARPLRLVPIVAQHYESVDVALEQGVIIAGHAGALTREVDLDSINLSGGEVDLAALAAMGPRLASATEALVAASETIGQSSSSWVLPALNDRIAELRGEVDELLPEVMLASEAVVVVPDLLGAVTPQTYLVMFGTPAESREFGGFLGSWALVSFDDGQVDLVDSGRKSELYSTAEASSILPESVPAWFLEMARPTMFPENLTSSPDFAVVAEATQQVLGELGDRPLDGIIYLDALALIDLLELSGPVDTPFQNEPLTSNNAQEFFFRDQYSIEGAARTEAFDELAEVGREILQRLSTQGLPGPEELGRVLGPAARAGRLQVITFDTEHNEFLRSVKLLRDFGREETLDFVGVVQSNGLANKMDLYLERRLDYQAAVGAGGELTATATVTLRSIVPSDAPEYTVGEGPTRAQNKVLLSVYTPLSLDGVTIDGTPGDVRIASEFGMGRYLVEVVVPPNVDGIVVEYSLSGSVSSDEAYSLEVWHQPLINDDAVTVAVTGLERNIEWSGPLNENLILFESPE